MEDALYTEKKGGISPLVGAFLSVGLILLWVVFLATNSFRERFDLSGTGGADAPLPGTEILAVFVLLHALLVYMSISMIGIFLLSLIGSVCGITAIRRSEKRVHTVLSWISLIPNATVFLGMLTLFCIWILDFHDIL